MGVGSPFSITLISYLFFLFSKTLDACFWCEIFKFFFKQIFVSLGGFVCVGDFVGRPLILSFSQSAAHLICYLQSKIIIRLIEFDRNFYVL